jgi:hypothetical protein
MSVDFQSFVGVSPFASELYAFRQAILGWRSVARTNRLTAGLLAIRQATIGQSTRTYLPEYTIQRVVADEAAFDVSLAKNVPGARAPGIAGLASLIGQQVLKAVEDAGAANTSASWQKFTTADFLRQTLGQLKPEIQTEYLNRVKAAGAGGSPRQSTQTPQQILAHILERESVSAGVLADLNARYAPQQLMLLLAPTSQLRGADLAGFLGLFDVTQSEFVRATLSPIAALHLFRQYFFEFDHYLGRPVQHIWLTPGASATVVEIATRASADLADDLSVAVHQDRAQDPTLGAGAGIFGRSLVGFVDGSLPAVSTFDLAEQEREAREELHRRLRLQSSRLAQSIRDDYRSSFKTAPDPGDIVSKQYSLQNPGDAALVNYELRRKMRHIGIQIQDYGTRLCWQAFVDQPGDSLGVASFVHLADLPDLSRLQPPDQTPPPAPLVRGQPVAVKVSWQMPDVSFKNFVPLSPPLSIVPPPGYVYDHSESVVIDGPHWGVAAWPFTSDDTTITISAPPPDYVHIFLSPPDDSDLGWLDADASGFIVQIPTGAPDGSTEPSVVQVVVGVVPGPGGLRDDSQHDLTIQMTPIYRPSKLLVKQVNDANATKIAQYNEEKQRAYQDALFKTARERITLASEVNTRPPVDLREEERVVVYRGLMKQLVTASSIVVDNGNVWHVLSEAIASIFDIDNMCYFVAPDWWMPRPQSTAITDLEGIGLTDASDQASFQSADVVSWGGPRALRLDNYYVTENSTPAKLGSSLGWLLQLDGDNLRNAFLNAPWVEAIVPIRPGREWQALDWMTSPQIEGGDGLSDPYQPANADQAKAMLLALRNYHWTDPTLANRYAGLAENGLTLLDALRYEIILIQEKEAQELTAPATAAGQPPSSTTLLDQVNDLGFAPRTSGFTAQPGSPYEVFDQWLEDLPTDQVVPVAVAYDPKSGKQS